MATIAINGLGRIGRAAFKIILETPELELRAVNVLNAADDLAYLLNHDTVYRRSTTDSQSCNGQGVTAGTMGEATGANLTTWSVVA